MHRAGRVKHPPILVYLTSAERCNQEKQLKSYIKIAENDKNLTKSWPGLTNPMKKICCYQNVRNNNRKLKSKIITKMPLSKLEL